MIHILSSFSYCFKDAFPVIKEIPQQSLNMYKNEYTLCCLPSSFIDFEWYITCIWLFLFKPVTISFFQSNSRLYVASSLKLICHSHWIKIAKRFSK